MDMNRLKRMIFGLLTAFALSTALPVTLPQYSSVMIADAAVVKLNITTTSVYIGDTVQLKILGTDKPVKWTANDTNIAKVSSKGLVTGLKKGTVTITASVNSKKYLSTIQVMPKELTAEEIYEKCSKATVEILAEVASGRYNLGSGFFIDEGIVITNFHVVSGASNIKITGSGKKSYNVEQVLGYDEKIDLVILKVNTQNEYLEKNEEAIKPGETVYTLGSPLGLTGSFADGMVSSPTRKIESVDYIQVTAPMSPGNSGGPLINKYGEVIGINTWQYAEGQNLNFSININEVQNIKTDKPLNMADFQKETAGKSSTTPADTATVADVLKSSGLYYGLLRLTDTDKTEYALLYFR